MIDDGTQEEHEELKARLVATKAALAAHRGARRRGVDARRHDRAHARHVRVPQAPAAPRGPGKIEDDGYEDRSLAYQTLLREVLEAQRREIVRLRNEGTISNEVMHRLERELDLEDERLEI